MERGLSKMSTLPSANVLYHFLTICTDNPNECVTGALFYPNWSRVPVSPTLLSLPTSQRLHGLVSGAKEDWVWLAPHYLCRTIAPFRFRSLFQSRKTYILNDFRNTGIRIF